MTRVMITVPCMDWVHSHVAGWLVRLALDGRYETQISLPHEKPYENNLHHIIVALLAGDCDYWLSMDSDNPPTRNPLDLVELDKDVIGLPTPIWRATDDPGEQLVHWNGYDYVPDRDKYREHQPQDGLQLVDAIGSGCFLAARRVFEHPGLQQGAFLRTLHENGTVHKGCDIAFSERATAAGFELFCHYDYRCQHFSELDVLSVAQSITDQRQHFGLDTSLS